jgi:hypothetical protein
MNGEWGLFKQSTIRFANEKGTPNFFNSVNRHLGEDQLILPHLAGTEIRLREGTPRRLVFRSNTNGVASLSPAVAESARLPWVTSWRRFINPEGVASFGGRGQWVRFAATPSGL